ncbi:hypothetical protein C8J56DRAFT_892076 [Mycena floridula]|nr:hypothetical protein C8J56DRAFT_892076 [Mycena floridula]
MLELGRSTGLGDVLASLKQFPDKYHEITDMLMEVAEKAHDALETLKKSDPVLDDVLGDEMEEYHQELRGALNKASGHRETRSNKRIGGQKRKGGPQDETEAGPLKKVHGDAEGDEDDDDAASSLRGACLDSLAEEHTVDSTLLMMVLSKYWTLLYPWLQFIVETVIASEVFLRADDHCLGNLRDVVCELLILTRDEIRVSQLPNQKRLSIRLWLYSARAGTNLTKLYGPFLASNEKPTGNLDVSTVIAQFPGGAAVVIGELQRASKQCRRTEDYITLAANLMLVCYAFPINSSGVHPMPLLCRQFSSAGVIPVLVQLMSRLTLAQNYVGENTVDEPSQVYQVASGILVNAINYLGPASVHQAFANGIFKVIIAAVPLL